MYPVVHRIHVGHDTVHYSDVGTPVRYYTLQLARCLGAREGTGPQAFESPHAPSEMPRDRKSSGIE